MRLLLTLIFLAVLFFSGKALWGFIQQSSAINKIAKQASAQIEEMFEAKSSLNLQNTFTNNSFNATSTNNSAEVASQPENTTEVINGITQMIYPPVVKRPVRKVIAELENKYAQTDKTTSGSYTVVEGGSSPANNIVAKVQTPLSFISYELNSVLVAPDGNLRVSWKLKNTSDQEITLNRDLRQLLSPTRLYVVDFRSQRRFAVKYDEQIPIANCMLTDSISPFGRVDCTALVGPVLPNNGGLTDHKVLVYLPGKMVPVRVFLNI